MTDRTLSDDLPPLPAPKAEAWGNSGDPRFDAFSADQMREYARAAMQAAKPVQAAQPSPEPAAWLGRALKDDGEVGAHQVYFSRGEAADFCVAAMTKGHYLKTEVIPLYAASRPSAQDSGKDA